MRDLVPWQRNALNGALVGLVVPVAAYLLCLAVVAVIPRSGMIAILPVFFLTPSYGIVTLMGNLPMWGSLTAITTINALVCSIIWAGIRSAGRRRWLFRAAVALFYAALLASSMRGLSRSVDGP